MLKYFSVVITPNTSGGIAASPTLNSKLAISLGFLHRPSLLFSRYFIVYLFRIIQNPLVFLFNHRAFYLISVWNKNEMIGHLLGFIPSKIFRLTDYIDGKIEISYSVKPEFRRIGVASYLLCKAININTCLKRNTIAVIRSDNQPSLDLVKNIYRYINVNVNVNANINAKKNIFFNTYSIKSNDYMSKLHPDKLIEMKCYDEQALWKLSTYLTSASVSNMLGSATMPHYLRTPYIFYEQCIASLIKPDHKVLELGSGTGLHTVALVETNAQVTATDIAPNSLKLIKQKFDNINTQVADIETLPFENNSFDVVTCAGSLSYGDPLLVDTEIKRVLKPNGLFICVDSLNHNLIYRFNRWIHYLRGHRTKSTLNRMPNLRRIRSLTIGFQQTEVRYFGSISFAMPIITRLFGEEAAAYLSNYIDSVFRIKRSAFKFVLVAQNFQK